MEWSGRKVKWFAYEALTDLAFATSTEPNRTRLICAALSKTMRRTGEEEVNEVIITNKCLECPLNACRLIAIES